MKHFMHHMEQDMIFEEIQRIRKEGIDEKLFEASKKALFGRYVTIFDKPSALAAFITSCEFADVEVYDIIECVANAKTEDIVNIIERTDIENTVLSIIKPY